MNQRYSSLRALNILESKGIYKLISDVYNFDGKLYHALKGNEGQYAYFSYISSVRQAIDEIFYQNLPYQEQSIANNLVSYLNCTQHVAKKKACIILNNTSELAHVTVLRSLSNELKSVADSMGVELNIFNLMHEKDQTVYARWKNIFSQSGFQIFESKAKSFIDRYVDMINQIQPEQCIWWGWPPGQWLGPLISPNRKHHSISFKYDYPSSNRFFAHHIGYGDSYIKHVYDSCKLYGFNQYFNTDLLPGFSLSSCRSFAMSKHAERIEQPYSNRSAINIGTLGRSEKIAQPQYLETIANLLERDHRLIFHWTGKTESQVVIDFFNTKHLSSRIHYHGWVQPEEYLKHLDLYLDTFPFGTGQTLVCAGCLGLPLVMMNSPYEANFSNLIKKESFLYGFIADSCPEYINLVMNIVNDEVRSFSTDICESALQAFTLNHSNNSGNVSGLAHQLFSS